MRKEGKNMKHTTRKLLSLLMALVMALSLMPVALATENPTLGWHAENANGHYTENSTTLAEGHAQASDASTNAADKGAKAATCTEKGYAVYDCTAEGCTAYFVSEIPATDHTWGAWAAVENQNKHQRTCTVQGCTGKEEADHTWAYDSTGTKSDTSHTMKCSVCNGTKSESHTTPCTTCGQGVVAVTGITLNKTTADMTVGGATLTLTATVTPENATEKGVTWSSDDSAVASVTAAGGVVTAKKAGTATITATAKDGSGKTASCTVTVTALPKGTIELNYKSISIGDYIIATPKAPTGVDYDTIAWEASNGNVKIEERPSSESVDVTGLKSGTAYVTATFKKGSTTVATATSDDITISSYSIDFTVYGYVGNDTEKYYLSEITDQYGDSIFDQIDDKIQNKKGYSDYYTKSIYFLTTTDTIGDLYSTTKAENAYFQLDKKDPATKKAEFVLEVTATNGTSRYDEDFYVELVLTVDDGASASSGDISYVAAIGDDVYFDAADFEDFYYDKTDGGTLKSVTFDTVSGGVLYCDDGKLSGKTCYVDPTTKQAGLDEVYFTPTGATAKNAKTVKIDFTAAGSKSSKTGTVSITYLNGEAKDITYSLKADGAVSLDAGDFTAAYKEVTKKTAPTGMTIVFQNAPAYGELTYTDSSKSKPKDVALTSRNIKSYSFTTRSSGSNQLGDVTYSGSSGRSDTIDYIAYSSGTALFTGKVVFNGKKEAPANLSVPFTCFGSAGTYFNAASFNAANTSVMSSAAYIRFGVPAHGSLTYGGVTATGVNIYVAALGSVLYQPNAGFNGTDTVIFAAYDASGSSVGSGQVNIVVSGNTAAAATNPGGSAGATSVDQFTDVPKTSGTAWYRDKLANLVSKGIMNGKGDGKFDPTGKVKNGEALKMVLLAAGYPAQATPAGNDWAINYKNLAVSNNLIGSGVVLTDDISRDAVAELAARALGLTPVTSGESPFVDSSNGYAIALYNAGIINGDTSSGSRKFLGGDTLQRAEICVIIYAMNEYVANRYASVKPDGI